MVFSVVIPTFNRAEKLRKALQSLSDQTYRDFEVLVCDDGSTDYTVEVLQSFQKVLNLKHLFEENWGGPARPRNRGVQAAKGEWICFLDSDDWWYPNKLEEVAKKLLSTVDFIFHDVDIYDSRLRLQKTSSYGKDLAKPTFANLMTRSNLIHNSSAVVRRSVLITAGPISEDRELISVEDFDLWLRIAKLTDNFVRIPMSLGGYGTGDVSISSLNEGQLVKAMEVFRRHMGDLPDSVQKKSLRVQNYIRGRMKLALGHPHEAREYLLQALLMEGFEARLKAVYFLILSQWNCWRRTVASK